MYCFPHTHSLSVDWMGGECGRGAMKVRGFSKTPTLGAIISSGMAARTVRLG